MFANWWYCISHESNIQLRGSLMKKIIVMLAVFFITGTAFAKVNSEGKMMLGVNGDYGFTLTGMSSSTDGESSIGKTYGIGLKAGYGIFKSGIVYGGLELQQRELVIKEYYWDGSSDRAYKDHYTQKYLDVLAAYRILFGPMYADFGGFYGIRVGSMKSKQTGYFSDSDTVPKKYTKNDFGLLLGIGTLIEIGETSGIDIGLKIKYGTTWVIDSNNFKLQCQTAVLTAGYTTFF
jgi:hypothetical protein